MANANMMTPLSSMSNPLIIDSTTVPTARDNGKFCVDGSGKMYRVKEIDGNTWTEVPRIESSDEAFYDIYYKNGMFFAIGDNIRWSTDAINWTVATLETPPQNYRCFSIEYANGKYVASGIHSLYYSDDGKNWTKSSTEVENKYYYCVVYGNGRFVTTGADGFSYYSTDGETWNPLTGLAERQPADRAYYTSLTYGRDRFVCCAGFGLVYSLLDGSNQWVLSNNGIDEYGSTNKGMGEICFGGDRFVGAGNLKISYYSLDGSNWTAMTGYTEYDGASAVIYGNRRFIMIGAEGHMYYSINGMSWLPMSSLAPIDPDHEDFRSATYTNDCVYVIQRQGRLYKTTPNGGVYVYYPLIYYTNTEHLTPAQEEFLTTLSGEYLLDSQDNFLIL